MPRRGPVRSWTDQDLIAAVQENKSVAGVLRAIGLIPAGGNYEAIKTRIRVLGIDSGHFTGRGWSRGRTDLPPTRIRRLEDILVISDRVINTNGLRQRLIKEGLIQPNCAKCGLSHWMGILVSLELDHINGDRRDNRIENLRPLCPNCHAQTDTYRGRNIKQIEPNVIIEKEIHLCQDCGKPNSKLHPRCKSCARKLLGHRIHWPDVATLLDMVHQSSYLHVSKQLGVSDNAIRKHLKNRGQVVERKTRWL